MFLHCMPFWLMKVFAGVLHFWKAGEGELATWSVSITPRHHLPPASMAVMRRTESNKCQ